MLNTQESKPVDLTRLNRHERRAYQAVNGVKVPGRNMPYVKTLHGTIQNFNAKRAEEIEADNKQLEENVHNTPTKSS